MAISRAHLNDNDKEAGYCLFFAENLTIHALEWFAGLERNSIDKLTQIVSAFLKLVSVCGMCFLMVVLCYWVGRRPERDWFIGSGRFLDRSKALVQCAVSYLSACPVDRLWFGMRSHDFMMQLNKSNHNSSSRWNTTFLLIKLDFIFFFIV